MSYPGGDVYSEQWRAIASWFIGPRAENKDSFTNMVLQCLDWHFECREGYYPSDPSYITDEVKQSATYQKEMEDLKEKLKLMHDRLAGSLPFFSTRYQGHMTWDVTMPALLGYISGVLWNQNNVDSTASPVTTQFEVEVGKELCDLLGYPRSDAYEPWGHITGCGSVANLEAMWAARNMKFHTLAVRKAVESSEDLKAGLDTPIQIPSFTEQSKTLGSLSQWEMLNLTVDIICSLTDDVKNQIDPSGESTDLRNLLDEQIKKFSLVQLGIGEFYRSYGIPNFPKVISPATNHYSWPKSATVLGLGDQCIIPIPVDGKVRQNTTELESELQKCLDEKVPVLMVVAVIGSTEEGAIDDLEKIYALKRQFEAQGLTFSLHADAAWGGYLSAMIHEPTETRVKEVVEKGIDYVPFVPLNDYVRAQYHALRHADTITIDPHKTGLCPYPAGGLCYRNGTMKGFITLEAPEVFHNPDDVSVGVYGLEGSKPGAAACGVLLSHRVIGLDIYGMGRILGQCQFGATLFYCMWFTCAREKDGFICKTTIDAPYDELIKINPAWMNEEAVSAYMRTNILGRSDVEISNDEEAMGFIKIVGPDGLINQYTVNLKGNTSIALCNDLNKKIFDELTVYVGQSPKRVPLFLTTSVLNPETYGEAVEQLKGRLGLIDSQEKKEELKFLRNTALQPFQSSGNYVVACELLFRNAVMNCIGALDDETYGDPIAIYKFIVAGDVNDDGKVFLELIPTFAVKEFQYHVILTMKCVDPDDIELFKESVNGKKVYMATKAKTKIQTFLRDTNGQEMAVLHAPITKDDNILNIMMKVDEVFRYEHFENPEYAINPVSKRYFMYGDSNQQFISHVISKKPDFYEVIKLDEKPEKVEDNVLDYGAIATVLTPNAPTQEGEYQVEFRGEKWALITTTLKFHNADSRVYYDDTILNNGFTVLKRNKHEYC